MNNDNVLLRNSLRLSATEMDSERRDMRPSQNYTVIA